MDERKTYSEVFQIRISEEMTKAMIDCRLENGVIWSEVVRDFIETKISELKNEKELIANK